MITEEEIRQIVQDELKEYVPTFTNINVPPHTHNGADSSQVQSANLLPYPILSKSANIPTGSIGNQGIIQFYSLPDSTNGVNQDWGFNIALGGIWNSFTIVPSSVGANQSSGQTIGTATATEIIFDNVLWDLYPNDTPEYDDTTGDFIPYTAGKYLIMAGVSFTNSSHSGEVSLSIMLERGVSTTAHMTKSIYVPSSATTVTIDVMGIVDVLENDRWYILFTQSTGANQTTLTDDNTWLNIQKMK